MSYAYADLNRLSTVVDNRLAGNNVTTYSYDNASNVALVTDPNGVQSSLAYDSLNRVSSLNSQVSGYTYQRSPTVNLTGANESDGRTESWSYDGICRLTNETITLDPIHANGAVTYGPDPVGDRLSEASSLMDVPSGSFSFNADEEFASEA
jgi:YD repeat-containing protein